MSIRDDLAAQQDRDFERYYHGHGCGVVVTQPEEGRFEERPMTSAEIAARPPAAVIAERIYQLAARAAFAYISAWEIIAAAIDNATAPLATENTRLKCLLSSRDTALTQCAAQFSSYAAEHSAKGNGEKERVNRQYAAMAMGATKET